MVVKTRSELEAGVPDNNTRAITPANIRDVIDSLGVGGVLFGNGLTQAITTSWAPFTAFDSTLNTRGVSADTGTGLFTLGAGADGFYHVSVCMTLDIPGNGWINLALSLNGGLTNFRTGEITVTANEAQQFVILGSGSLSAGDTVGVAIDGSGSATANVNSAQFAIDR